MADKKISALTEETTPELTDILAIVDPVGGTTRKVTLQELKDLMIIQGGTSLLVAANNAPSAIKSRADYVCDGTNDEVEILAAVAALPAAGGKIIFSEGNFNLGSLLEIDMHAITFEGAGIDATTFSVASTSFGAMKFGDRELSGIMRNHVHVKGFRVNLPGSSLQTGILFDGMGFGFVAEDIQTNEGNEGIIFKDIDRGLIINAQANNPRRAGLVFQTGLENTYGTLTIIDSWAALSDNNTDAFLFETADEQGSPNRFDRITMIGCLYYATAGLTGTSGLTMNVGATAFTVLASLFENTMNHVELNDETQITLIGCSMIQNDSTPTTNAFACSTDNHLVTIQDCRIQKVTNVFNGISGQSKVCLLGQTTNQGNITNIFAGTFAAKFGTDTVFAGDGNLAHGLNSTRYDYEFANKYILNPANASPGENLVARGFIAEMTAGENLAFGDVCYLKSDGKMWKIDADAIATMPGIAMAAATISADAAGEFLFHGFARKDAWAWTVGARLYASLTAGEFTETAPSGSGDVVQPIAIATHADRIYFNPSLFVTEIP